MRVYFHTSALNRPLDDLSSERVRLEAEAVVGLLAAVEGGRVDWVGSSYLCQGGRADEHGAIDQC